MCVFFGFNLVEVDFVARKKMLEEKSHVFLLNSLGFNFIQAYLKVGGENLLEEKGQNLVVILKSIMSYQPVGSPRSLMIQGTGVCAPQTLNFAMVSV
jgi:hypothetical protein